MAGVDPVADALAVIKVVGGIFKSKKHYHLYYYDPPASSWKFVLDGHPDEVNSLAKSYRASGFVVAIIRNKGDKFPDGTLAPASPPAGYKATPLTVAGLNPWILAGMAGAAILVFFLMKRRGR